MKYSQSFQLSNGNRLAGSDVIRRLTFETNTAHQFTLNSREAAVQQTITIIANYLKQPEEVIERTTTEEIKEITKNRNVDLSPREEKTTS